MTETIANKLLLQISIELASNDRAIALAGTQEENLKILARETGAKLVLRGQELIISGTSEPIDRARALIRLLQPLWQEGKRISAVEIRTAVQALDAGNAERLRSIQTEILATNRKGERIHPKTVAQWDYVRAIRQHELTFCIGPAGTGKTYLAAVLAVQALLNGECERTILTRPAVEAGEKLGFLPGDLQQKVDPFLRPLYDALHEFIDADKIPSLIEKGTIEIAPLAYMRGRTLSNAFVIVDEAQNTTPSQMKMLLTRLGNRSRMVVTGDITQTDLPANQTSGLLVAQQILQNIEGIKFCYFTKSDVVRHALVERIVAAYERHETVVVKEQGLAKES
ncbi:MAG: PhoH family protein [Chamaesiphon sp. CSU_1_12]|nr:PhoH family protein [Chamaesiphon sp. CSU_1_12]